MRRLLVALAMLIMLFPSGCAQNQSYSQSVPELLAEADGSPVDLAKVAGVFVEAPVTTEAGTIFTMAESLDSKERLDVYLPETEELEVGWGTETLSGDGLLGHTLIVTGSYDGEVFVADHCLIQYGGGYGEGGADAETTVPSGDSVSSSVTTAGVLFELTSPHRVSLGESWDIVLRLTNQTDERLEWSGVLHDVVSTEEPYWPSVPSATYRDTRFFGASGTDIDLAPNESYEFVVAIGSRSGDASAAISHYRGHLKAEGLSLETPPIAVSCE